MNRFGNPLLHNGRHLSSHMRRVGSKITDAVHAAFQDDPGLSPSDLQTEMEQAFCLQPLALGELLSVAALVIPVFVKTDGGIKAGYVAEARVSFTGSPHLWQARPPSLQGFPYTGTVAQKSVGWRTFVADFDLTDFAADVADTFARVRDALQEYAPSVESRNPAIKHLIEQTIRGHQ